jgi:hypothetical protein
MRLGARAGYGTQKSCSRPTRMCAHKQFDQLVFISKCVYHGHLGLLWLAFGSTGIVG